MQDFEKTKDSNSIYFATEHSPVFALTTDAGATALEIAPIPTDAEPAKVYYYTASATSGTFACNIYFEAFTDGDTVDLEAAQGIDTGGNAGTATVPGTAGHLDVITITLSNKDSEAAGDLCRLLIIRDVSEDGASGDVYLANIELYEET